MSPSRSPSPTSMAATMGFSSFGSKPNPPKKKQKLSSSNPESTGTNSTPIGVRSRQLDVGKTTKQGSNNARKDYGDGRWKGEDITANISSSRSSMTGPDATSLHRYEVPLSDLVPTPSHDVTNESQRHQSGHIDPHGLDENVAPQHQNKEEGEGPRPEAGRRADGTWDWQALRKGVRDERGDMAFYDGSFVEDPWSGLRRGQG